MPIRGVGGWRLTPTHQAIPAKPIPLEGRPTSYSNRHGTEASSARNSRATVLGDPHTPLLLMAGSPGDSTEVGVAGV